MKKVKICDTHNDFLTELNENEILSYIKKCKEQRVEIICSSFWSTNFSEVEICQKLTKLKNALVDSKSKFLLHIEDLFWVKNEKTLKHLLKINPFSCSLTWNNKNALATGNNEKGGLSQWGEFCVQKLISQGIVIDCAHLNRTSFWDLTKIVKSNLYCSHTGFCGICKSKRNLTDMQIEKIVDSDGFVGVFFYDKCVKIKNTNNFDVFDIVQNIKYFTNKWGYDNIGIGSDFYGIEKYPQNLKNYSDFENLVEGLKKEGFTLSQIEKIFFKNFLDFKDKIKTINC